MDEKTAAILDRIHGLSTVQLDLLLAAIEEVKDDLRFHAWLNGVNKALATVVPLSTEDLPDQSYRDWHEAGMTSFHAAQRVLKGGILMGQVQYIGRNTIFGNPVKLGRSCAVCGKLHPDIDPVLACYRRYLSWRLTPAQEHLGKIAAGRCKQMPGNEMGALEFRKAVLALDGKILICPGCGKDAPKCHGRILESAIAWLKKSEVT